MNKIKININQMVENNVTVNAEWMLAEITEKVKEWELEEDVEKDILTKWENSLNNLNDFYRGGCITKLQYITGTIQFIYKLWLEDCVKACENNEDGICWNNDKISSHYDAIALDQLCNDCEIDDDVLRAELALLILKTSIKDDVFSNGYTDGNSIVWGF